MSVSPKEFVNPLPQTGIVRDIDFAAAIGISRETLVDWLEKFEMQDCYSRPGTRIFIDVAKFYDLLPRSPVLGTGRKPKGKRLKGKPDA